MVQHSIYLDMSAIGRMHRHQHPQNPNKLELQELSMILLHPGTIPKVHSYFI